MKRKLSTREPSQPIHYQIEPIHPEAHLFEVRLRIESPDPAGQKMGLPVWIPGSYLVREFAKHIVSIEATNADLKATIGLKKLDKNTWIADPLDGPLLVTYRIYAWDPSVRAAHLDPTHGFFNGTSVFLRVHGQEHLSHGVAITRPKGERYASWRVATTLPEDDAKRHGFGGYHAENYDALVDHPVEMGEFALGRFKALGVPHEIAITGRVPNLDMERICTDLKRVCEAQIRLFEPRTQRAPFRRYVFLLTVLGDGYGGLEHRASTSLICSRESLPSTAGRKSPDSYPTFLGLVSHEYFHSWNVKRIKPKRFAPYDYDKENYTCLLWIFEGFTSYYDDLVLVRTGLISEESYLDGLARTISEVQAGSGRFKQSVAESSFDAWIKYYRPDENAPNAVVSYYKKGALIGLGLDLLIRSTSDGRRCLDDVMRLLWKRYGREFYPQNADGVGEEEFTELVLESTGVDVRREIRQWAYGKVDPPLTALLKPFGVRLTTKDDLEPEAGPIPQTANLGVRVSSDHGNVRVTTVLDGGVAQLAGLSAGDILVALDGLRIAPSNLDALLARYAAGQSVSVHVFRRDELIPFQLKLGTQAPLQWHMSIEPGRRRLRHGWLRQG